MKKRIIENDNAKICKIKKSIYIYEIIWIRMIIICLIFPNILVFKNFEYHYE